MLLRSASLLLSLSSCATLGVPPATEDLVHQLDREVLALKKRNRMLEKQATSCDDPAAPPPAIFSELTQVFFQGDVRVERRGATTLVTIPGEKLFASGSVRVRTEADMLLDLLATGLRSHPDHPLRVTGHTDDTALTGRLTRTYPSNWELSTARAAAVARSLMTEYGVSPHRFTVAGRGAFEPIADNSTSAGRSTNRRVVIEILPPENP